MHETIKKVVEIVDKHNKWRREECLNMIASENVMSPLAEKYFVSDFEGRYNEHDEESHYQGTKFSNEIERLANSIFAERFDTSYVDTRPIAGAIANLIVYNAFLRPGDVFVAPGLTAGAHVSSTRYGIAGVRGLNSVDAFFDEERFVMDVDMTAKLIEKVKSKLVMLGRSMFIFPEPIEELRNLIGDKVKIVYDAAHVFGLIYGGKFQQPLEEGANIMTASTHKTFPGPQGGIIIARRDLAERDWERIQRSVFPGVLSNHHIHRLPSLAITAVEMNVFGKEYAEQVVRNAKAFAKALADKGFKILAEDYGFTESHQVLVDVKEFGGGKVVAEKMEKVNIIINKIAFPWDKDVDATKNPSGVRIGVQELTRFGMKEKEMEVVAEFYERVLIKNEDLKKVKQDVIEFRKDYLKPRYCFEVEE